MSAKASALHCPIRGVLAARRRAVDQLTFTEEKLRIDLIHRLLSAGYDKNFIATETIVLRVGHKGRNAVRADVVVFDEPVAAMRKLDLAEQLGHMRIICEVKRDKDDAERAKETQLQPALMMVPHSSVVGVYWDDVEQSLRVKEAKNGSITIRDASIANLPGPGAKWKYKELTSSDLDKAESLTAVFAKIDDILHQAGHDQDERYSFLLQIIVLKIFDEQSNVGGKKRLIIQDFTDPAISDSDVVRRLQDGLKRSLELYQQYLPVKIRMTFDPSAATLRQVSRWLCQINLLGSSPEVMQEFYMYFARTIYKVDLAQHFTPYEVIDFIVKLANPKFGDVVKDPACGSADFLVAAFRVARERHGANIAAQVHGADIGKMAVQVSVLNMILNGDGKTSIKKEDSLASIAKHEGKYSVMLCNPPFGSKIVERRRDILNKYDLGRGEATSQETGILFAELCVRSTRPGGRTAIILPNGYLGNRSGRYLAFREWLIKQTRPVAVVGFPRFTFKRSGADVSASVVVLERREKPLRTIADAGNHPVYFGLIEKIGWDVANKRAARLYKVEQNTGARVLDESNEPVLDSDLADVLCDLYSSPVVDEFPWLNEGLRARKSRDGYWVEASEIYGDKHLIIDPKRRCQKYQTVRANIENSKHLRLGDILELVPTKRFSKVAQSTYRYVEIGGIFENFGTYQWQELRGWQLPGRARLQAQHGDFFVANIWSSAGKWLRAGPEAQDGKLIVTNGCIHARVKQGAEKWIPDLVFGLSSELFRVQMRALATGSDGLSTILEDDFFEVLLPKIPDKAVRDALEIRLQAAATGVDQLAPLVESSLSKFLPAVNVAPRWSHIVQV